MKNTLNRRILLRQRPSGDYDPKILERVVDPIPVPGPGQALVRNQMLSLDPTNRIWMREEPSYLPPVKLGGVMRGVAVGEVIASNNSKYKVGATVAGLLGWQDYALIGKDDESEPIALPSFPKIPPAQALGVLGTTGMTAYFGLLDIGRPKRGETVFVSAAAGAVGSIVGQIAKIQGCRVVGIAGTRDKCDWLKRELGFDAAICRRDKDWRAQMKAACPDGIDVNFENAGGEIMDAAIELMSNHGRFVLCGMISQYNKADGDDAGKGDFQSLLIKRIKLQGFIILDYMRRFPLAQLRMMWWMKRGLIKDQTTIVRGLDNAPQALKQLFNGDNTGKLLVEIDEPPTRV
ncbi:MAG: NADP-dependent oxidoreductase [Pseudomonadota bacterium]